MGGGWLPQMTRHRRRFRWNSIEGTVVLRPIRGIFENGIRTTVVRLRGFQGHGPGSPRFELSWLSAGGGILGQVRVIIHLDRNGADCSDWFGFRYLGFVDDLGFNHFGLRLLGDVGNAGFGPSPEFLSRHHEFSVTPSEP